MAETKKKNTTKKATTKETKKKVTKPVKKVTKPTAKTKPTPKKQETIKKVTEVEKKIVKKEETKLETVKTKTTPKKVEKKVEKKIEQPVEKKVETKQEQLERTIIFDGAQKRNLQEVVERLEKENVVLKDKVVKRSKANKYIVLSLIILIIGIMIYCSVYALKSITNEIELKKPVETLNTNIFNKIEALKENEKTEEKEESKEDKKDTDSKKEDTAIISITVKEFEQKVLNGENFNVLISSTSCYFCYTFEPTAEKVLKELDKKIYKIDIYYLTKEEINRFREYYAFRITPTIFTIENGVVTKEKTGSQTEEDFKTWAQDNLL